MRGYSEVFQDISGSFGLEKVTFENDSNVFNETELQLPAMFIIGSYDSVECGFY